VYTASLHDLVAMVIVGYIVGQGVDAVLTGAGAAHTSWAPRLCKCCLV